MSSTLDKTEKKIKETDHALQLSKEDKHKLEQNILTKENAMKENIKNASPKEAALSKEAAK